MKNKSELKKIQFAWSKIFLITFLAGFLIGLSSGILITDIRLKNLREKQLAQKIEENRQINNLLEKFSLVTK